MQIIRNLYKDFPGFILRKTKGCICFYKLLKFNTTLLHSKKKDLRLSCTVFWRKKGNNCVLLLPTWIIRSRSTSKIGYHFWNEAKQTDWATHMHKVTPCFLVSHWLGINEDPTGFTVPALLVWTWCSVYSSLSWMPFLFLCMPFTPPLGIHYHRPIELDILE